MSCLNKLDPNILKQIDAALDSRRKSAFPKFYDSDDKIAFAIQKGLEQDFDNFKQAISKNNTLQKIANSIILLADYFDACNKEVAVAHLEDAIEKLAEIYPCEYVDADFDKNAAPTLLLEASDMLDRMGYEEISDSLDSALHAFLNNCSCK